MLTSLIWVANDWLNKKMTSHEEYVVVLADLTELILHSALELYMGNTSSASNWWFILQKKLKIDTPP